MKTRKLLAQIRAFAHAGGVIYAECGGLLYLSQQLSTIEGAVFPMAKVLPFAMEMTDKLVDFGYVTVTITQNCLLGPKGMQIRGHSFHYSRMASSTVAATSYDLEFSLSGKRQHGRLYRRQRAGQLRTSALSQPTRPPAGNLVAKARATHRHTEALA